MKAEDSANESMLQGKGCVPPGIYTLKQCVASLICSFPQGWQPRDYEITMQKYQAGTELGEWGREGIGPL